METISSKLLDAIEEYLADRMFFTEDGAPGLPAQLLLDLQAERDQREDVRRNEENYLG